MAGFSLRYWSIAAMMSPAVASTTLASPLSTASDAVAGFFSFGLGSSSKSSMAAFEITNESRSLTLH